MRIYGNFCLQTLLFVGNQIRLAKACGLYQMDNSNVTFLFAVTWTHTCKSRARTCFFLLYLVPLSSLSLSKILTKGTLSASTPFQHTG